MLSSSSISPQVHPEPPGLRRTPRVAILATYFGNWPVWFPAFLRSCETNTTIDWRFYTDCPPPSRCPSNVTIIPATMDGLNERTTAATGIPVRKNLYSQCDLRPAYGLIFAEELSEYDFWGHCDLDVVWGDLRRFMPDEILADADIVHCPQTPLSPRPRAPMSGHLTLWRNSEAINTLYRQIPDYVEKLSTPKHTSFGEYDTCKFLLRNQSVARTRNAVHPVADYFDLERHPYGWRWEDGKVYDASGQEWPYLHFMSWKRYLKHIDFGIEDSPRSFVVQRRGIWSKGLPGREAVLNKLSYDNWFSRGILVKRSAETLFWRIAGEKARKAFHQRKRRHW